MQPTACAKCRVGNRPGARFCDQCGFELAGSGRSPETEATSDRHRPPLSGHESRQVTVLFCDLVGSTTLSEGRDLEEFKEILSGFLYAAKEVLQRRGGTVEKNIGDAVMSVFGAPEAHEDDASRAVRAAFEIHERVEGLFQAIARLDVGPLVAHSGIYTGRVLTNGGDSAQSLVGVVGHDVNVAMGLCALAKPGEILVGELTRELAEKDFLFEQLPPTKVKGKSKASAYHRAIGPRELPNKTHRFPGRRRTKLVGRDPELDRLKQVDDRVRDGDFSAVFVCGEAGTGKSRLVEEYRELKRPDNFFWSEGQANDSARGVPYHPILDLLGRSWGIQGDVPPDRLRNTIETRLAELIADPGEVTPYVLSLYALDHPELTGISPEYWKRRLFSAVQAVFEAMARRGQSVFLFEDLHWADPSTLELLRHLIDKLRVPAIVLCTSRVPFRDLRPFQNAKSTGTGATAAIEEIVLEPLAPEETTVLTRGLLGDDEAPGELFTFMQEKADGNPFYVEEVLNSLIENGVLERRDNRWRLTKPLVAFDVPPTVEGVIASRLDRQDPHSRRLLQEAAVMGRTFLLPILREITKCRGMDARLSDLVESDLIRASSVEPDITYLFKHALTREVAYGRLPRSERAAIHQQVAEVMERLFADRLPEFFETLAFHFKQGRDVTNAAKYFIKSGEKAVNHFALEEANEHFRHAYELLQESEETEERRKLKGDLLEKWAILFYYYGDFRGLLELFGTHGTFIQSLQDKSLRGMLTAWSGVALFFRNRPEKAYHALKSALMLGEEVGDLRVIAYAVTWLTMVCGGLARFEEGIAHGERAQSLAQTMPDEHYLHFKSLGMLGFNYAMMGEAAKTHQLAETLIDFGKRNPRSLFFGYWMRAEGHSLAGNAKSARDAAEQGLRVLKDPFYLGFARAVYGMKCLLVGEQSASLDQALEQAVEQGNEFMVNWWRGFVGLGRVLRGQPAEGLRLIEEASQSSAANGDTLFHQVNEYLKAKVFLQAFLAGHEASAEDRAGSLLMKAIEYWRQMGARGWLGQALLDLGLLHQAGARQREARACWTEAADLFEKVGADMLLEQVRGLLAQSA